MTSCERPRVPIQLHSKRMMDDGVDYYSMLKKCWDRDNFEVPSCARGLVSHMKDIMVPSNKNESYLIFLIKR